MFVHVPQANVYSSQLWLCCIRYHAPPSASQPRFLNQAANSPVCISLDIDIESSTKRSAVTHWLARYRRQSAQDAAPQCLYDEAGGVFWFSDTGLCHPLTLCTIKLSVVFFEAKELTVLLSSGAKRRSRSATSTGRTGERSVELRRSNTALLNVRKII